MDVARVRESIGDPLEVFKSLEKFEKDSDLFKERYAEFLADYPDQFVVFYDGEVQSHAPDLDEVSRLIDDKDLPRGQVVVKFIEKTPVTWLL